MADRYYLCEIVGNGNIDAPEPWGKTTGPFRPALQDLVSYHDKSRGIRHQIAFKLQIGKYALCNVSSLDFTEVESYTGTTRDYAPPDSLLDVPLDSDMTNAHKSFFGNLLKKWLGYNNNQANSVVNQITTYRQAFDFMLSEIAPGTTIDRVRAKAV